MNPNNQLRHEREMRGWSQQKVAEAVGTTARTVSRWELGLSRPYPYFREQLCTLFGKNMTELGLLNEDPLDALDVIAIEPLSEDTKRPEQSSATYSNNTTIEETANESFSRSNFPDIYDPSIPPSLAGQSELVGRDQLLRQIKQQLQVGEQVAITALNGLPGVGKTALAIALASDPDIKARFRDGILWAGLCPGADIPGLLQHWGLLLGLAPEDMMKLQGIRAWSLALRRAIGQRRMLLVIDDAWKLEDALSLQVGGPLCSYIVTTRLASLAAQIANNEVVVVPELSEEDGIALLKRFAPEVVNQEPETARELVGLVGGLPLAQVLIGRYLHTEAIRRQPKRLQRAVEQLRLTEQRLRLALPLLALSLPSNLVPGSPWSLQAAIAVSDQQLDKQARKALRALSVFPAKPNSFSEDAALAVCRVPVEVLDTLSDSGLLESQGGDCYTLHQTIADYARTQLDDQSAYENLIDYYISYVEANHENFPALSAENTNIVAALDAAYKLTMQEKYIRLFIAFSHLFLRIGEIDIYERYVQRAYELAQDSTDVNGTLGVLIHLVSLQDKLGDYEKAEENLQRAFKLAQQNGGHRLLGLTYVVGTRPALSRGDYNLVEEHANIALTLGLQRQDKFVIYLAYCALAWIAGIRGKYQELEHYAHEILKGARQDNSHEFMFFGLFFLGQRELSARNYIKAQKYAQESLDYADVIKYDEFACQALDLLSQIERLQGKYQQAYEYAEQGLERAQRSNVIRMVGTMQLALGEVLLAQKKIEDAEAAFRDAQRIIPKQLVRLQAMALYGLARVEAEKGNLQAAQECGEESLKMLKGIGHHDAEKVSEFIEGGIKF